MYILIKYMKPYWKSSLSAAFLMVFQVVADLLQPKFMAKIVDQGIKTVNIDLIIKTGLLMIGIALIGLLSGLGCTTASSIASMNLGADIRSDIFIKVQSFSFKELDKFKTSSLITRLTNDVNQIQNVALMSMRVLIRAPFLCVGGLIMAIYTTNLKLASILLFSIPILIIAIVIVIKKGFPLFMLVQKKLDRLNTVMRENLSGVRVIKAFVRHDWEKKRFNIANMDLKNITLKATQIMVVIMPLMMLIMNLSIVAVIVFGGFLTAGNKIQVGEIIAFINYMTLILFSLLMMAYVLIIFSRAKASADRINEVLDTNNIEFNNNSNNKILSGDITFQDVTFSYDKSSNPVLKNISFYIRSGETIGIIGGTGSGKSTLVSLIPRLYETYKGKIFIDNKDIKDIENKTLRNNISLVLQETILFSGTIKENILWGNKEATESDVYESAKIAQAHSFIMDFEKGYEKVLSKRGVNISGGQKQRISIARALIKRPRILILDDSTSAVDLETENRIQKSIKKYINNTTCIIIAQKISSIKEADKIFVMDNGEIIDKGTHHELIKNSKIYKEICKSQYGKVEI